MNGWSISWYTPVGITSKIHNQVPGARERGGDFSTSDRTAALKMGISHKELRSAGVSVLAQSIFVFVFFLLAIKWIFL